MTNIDQPEVKDTSILTLVRTYTFQACHYFNLWFPTFKPTLEKRLNSLGKNFLHEIIFGGSFVYPFKVCFLDVIHSNIY